MKIALVGPGLMNIPPTGWGAVEILIWKYYLELQKNGYDVTIFNSQDLKKVINEINTHDFDFVHVHYDEFITDFLKYCKVPFSITSHFGYITKKEKWPLGYFPIFVDFLQAPHIIALSEKIKKLYQDSGYLGQIAVLRNGINVEQFTFNEKGNGKVLCLGKIEPRKRQAELSQILNGKVHIDFVGPLEDKNFKEGETCKYLGVWTKEEVFKKLTEYSVLILLSEGEAAPMVVVEALAAGLSVVVSESASANLDNKEYITILDDKEKDPDIVTNAILELIKKNNSLRREIREYSFEKFDNSVIFKEYESIIQDCFKNKYKIIKKNNFKKNNFLKYYIAKLRVFLSKKSFIRKIINFLKKI